MSKTTPTHYPVNLMALATQLGLDAFQFNALKYICRAGKKENETYADDISKAIESLQMGLDHHAGKEAGKEAEAAGSFSFDGFGRLIGEFPYFPQPCQCVLKRSTDNMDGKHGPALLPSAEWDWISDPLSNVRWTFNEVSITTRANFPDTKGRTAHRPTPSEMAEYHNPDHPNFGAWAEREYGCKPGEYVGVRLSPDINSQRVVEIRKPGVRIPKASEDKPEVVPFSPEDIVKGIRELNEIVSPAKSCPPDCERDCVCDRIGAATDQYIPPFSHGSRRLGGKIPKASDPDPEWDAAITNMTTPA